jgi:hypothetical protein
MQNLVSHPRQQAVLQFRVSSILRRIDIEV